jgi:hypothetical protein
MANRVMADVKGHGTPHDVGGNQPEIGMRHRGSNERIHHAHEALSYTTRLRPKGTAPAIR